MAVSEGAGSPPDPSAGDVCHLRVLEHRAGGVVTSYWCELALVDGVPRSAVAIDVENGRFGSITAGAEPAGDAMRLRGFTIPGLANAHSHAFHRALRSRTQAGRGTFWTW